MNALVFTMMTEDIVKEGAKVPWPRRARLFLDNLTPGAIGRRQAETDRLIGDATSIRRNLQDEVSSETLRTGDKLDEFHPLVTERDKASDRVRALHSIREDIPSDVWFNRAQAVIYPAATVLAVRSMVRRGQQHAARQARRRHLWMGGGGVGAAALGTAAMAATRDSEGVKHAFDELDRDYARYQFDERLNRDINAPSYMAISSDPIARQRLRHVPGLPFLRLPDFLVRRLIEKNRWKPGSVMAPKDLLGYEMSGYDFFRSGAFSKRDPRAQRLMPALYAKGWSQEEKDMLTDLFKAHEVDEATTTPGRTFMRHGHNAPEVILREHNRMVGLDPERYGNVRQLHKEMRGAVDGPVSPLARETEVDIIRKVDPSFRYGEGPALSEDQIKDLSRRLEGRALRRERLFRAGWAGAALGGAALLARKALKSRAAQQAMRRKMMAGAGVAGAAALGGGAYAATRD